MTDDEILEIRDSLLPSQGEQFDQLAFGRAVAAAVASRFSKGDGYFFVIHPDDPSINLLPDGTTVIFQRNILRSNKQ